METTTSNNDNSGNNKNISIEIDHFVASYKLMFY